MHGCEDRKTRGNFGNATAAEAMRCRFCTHQEIFVLPSWKNILSLGIPNSPVSSGGNVAVMSPCTSMCSPPPGFFLTEDDVANFLDMALDTALSLTS